jgi:hypothetical protein
VKDDMAACGKLISDPRHQFARQMMIEQQFHAGSIMTVRSRSAAKLKQA